ncbi:MAG TPA: GNAT family N-acetyltransferase [Candidatus Norongarragalinales archaeon]|nr:GNAT family N-acetyltransferase [Candidatus Norongarragalinales archaeon]
MEEPKAVDLTHVARVRAIGKTEIGGKKIIIEELIPKIGDFDLILQAREERTNNLVAHASLQKNHPLSVSYPEAFSLRNIKVQEKYAGTGFGSILLALTASLAKNAGVQLVLNPEPSSTKRLNTRQLWAWYQRHGFRRLTKTELSNVVRSREINDIAARLWFSGYEHETQDLTGPKRYSAALADTRRIKQLPYAQLVSLYEKALAADHTALRPDYLIKSYRAISQRICNSHLILDPETAEVSTDSIAQIELSPKYSFPSRKRLEADSKRLFSTER